MALPDQLLGEPSLWGHVLTDDGLGAPNGRRYAHDLEHVVPDLQHDLVSNLYVEHAPHAGWDDDPAAWPDV